MLHGMSESHGRRIQEGRAEAAFRSLEDFGRRTGLGRSVTARLAKAGAFRSLELGRREALWHALGQDSRELPLFDREGSGVGGRESGVGERKAESGERDTGLDGRVRETHQMGTEESTVRETREAGVLINNETHSRLSETVRSTHPPVELPQMSAAEEVLADYRTQGLSLEGHPMEFLREGLNRLGVSPAGRLSRLPHGGPVRVAGIVLVRQRPGTAKGITFVTLEDETGVANLIIRPDVWKRWRSAALGATILLASGRLQRQGRVIHVLTTQLENLSSRMKELGGNA